MSQPTSPSSQRSYAGMAGAMVVAVLVAGVWYFLGRPDEDVRPVRTVEWSNWVKSARADGKLVTFAPKALPDGWRATSANYRSGVDAHWHLGVLTRDGKFIGIEEARDSTEDLIDQYVDDEADQGEDATVGGETWKVFTDSGGDYALIRTVEAPDGQQERLLVYGSATDAQVRQFATTLQTTGVSDDGS